MSSGGEDNLQWSGLLEFRDTKHEIIVKVENDELLLIQIENCETFDQWEGKYDVTYIEELSHKTGNFKQFGVFCSMLESALLQNSESVTLDLLTYEDLKVLREQKLGKQRRRHKRIVENKLQTKRYLIMTYSVEFDQIHYPLPLTYVGKTDPASLKNQICDFKLEIENLKRQLNRGGRLHGTEAEYKKLLMENKELRELLAESQQRLQDVGTGNVSKELKVLKKVVQNLETDLLKERSKHQRVMTKKKKEYDELLEEFEELKANERNYRVRCKNLTEELAMLKRNSRLSPMTNNRIPRHNSSGNKHKSYNTPRERKNSTSSQRGRSTSRSISRNRDRSASASSIGRTPSPGFRRFDPSAYIKEKERKRQEAETSRSRRFTPSSNSKRNRTSTSFGDRQKPPCGVNGRHSSVKRKSNARASSGSDYENIKPKSSGSGKRESHRNRNRSIKSDTSDDEFYRRNIPKSRVAPARNSKSPKNNHHGDQDEDSTGRSIGIAEIDARLEALQRFMKDNMD